MTAVDAERRPGMFWLAGSQQSQMMKGLSETLAGRVAIMHLLGFSGRERHKLELDELPFRPTSEAAPQVVQTGDGKLLRRLTTRKSRQTLLRGTAWPLLGSLPITKT